MKQILLSLWIIACFWGHCAIAEMRVVEKSFVEFSDAGRPGEVRIRHIEGDVFLEQGKQAGIRVELLARDRKIESIEQAASGLLVHEERNVVTVRVNAARSGADLRLILPPDTSVRLVTVDGDIMGNRLSGDLELSTRDGDIQLKQITGHLVIHTVDGDVEVELLRPQLEKPLSVATVDGDILLHLPENLQATLDISTLDGDVDCDLPLSSSQHNFSSPLVGQRTRGDLNGGGFNIQLKTIDGDVQIRKTIKPD